MLSGVTKEKEEREYIGGFRPKFPNTVSPTNVSFARALSHYLKKITSTKAETCSFPLWSGRGKWNRYWQNTQHGLKIMILKEVLGNEEGKCHIFGKCKLRNRGWYRTKLKSKVKLGKLVVMIIQQNLSLVNQRGRIHKLLKLRGQTSY